MNSTNNNQTQELLAYVHGEVQGVGFRYFVVRKAHSLGLHGYTRNNNDGSVEVLAQGPRSTLDQLLTQLRRGPSAANVSDVSTTWRQPTEHFSGFNVRY